MQTFTDARVLRLVNMTIQETNLLPVTFGSGSIGECIRFLFVMHIPVVEVDDGGQATHHPQVRTVVEQFRWGWGNNSPVFGERVKNFSILSGGRFCVLDIEPSPLSRTPFLVIWPIQIEGSVIISSQVRTWGGRGKILSL